MDPLVRYVSTTGSDDGAGTAAHPYRTISRAIDALPKGGGAEVRVAAGTYEIPTPVQLVEGISLKGGYSADWEDRGWETPEARADARFRTVIAPAASGEFEAKATIVAEGSDLSRSTIVEGFTVAGRPAPGTAGASAVLVSGGASPVLSHDTFLAALDGTVQADTATVLKLDDASGSAAGSALVASSLVQVGSVTGWEGRANAVAIDILDGSHVIDGNEIDAGVLDSTLSERSSDGIVVTSRSYAGTVTIRNNVVRAGTIAIGQARYAAGAAVSVHRIPAIVTNNVLVGGPTVMLVGEWGHLQASFNTLVLMAPTGTTCCGLAGIYRDRFTIEVGDSFTNNIVFAPPSAAQSACISLATTDVTIRNNDLFGCDLLVLFDYRTLSRAEYRDIAAVNAAWGGGSVSIDPRFVDPAQGDYRLEVDPANLDVRGGAAALDVTTDLTGAPRTSGVPTGMTNVDASGMSMGAYEVD